MLQHVAMSLGDPPKPVEDPDWTGVNFSNITAMESAEFVVIFLYISYAFIFN